MCSRSKVDPAVLERRQDGLDSRGNVPANARAESAWAAETFKKMDGPTTELLAGDILKLYAKADQIQGGVDKMFVKKFKKGVNEIFGSDHSRKPSPEQLSTLMFGGAYGFKDATDAINRQQKEAAAAESKTSGNADLYTKGRSGPEFANEKGRLAGPKRKNSFSNVDAGITDRVNRDDETRDFFATKVVHAKGTLQGDESSDIYKKYADAEAPFIGGASGTMQGLILGMEMEKPKADLTEAELKAREKLIGLHMAALINGGHHSASECLIAAKKYGYFGHVTDPIGDNGDYTNAMKGLGDRLTAVGLPTDLTAKVTAVGDPWRKAIGRLKIDLRRLQDEIGAEYTRRDRAPGPLIVEFRTKVRAPLLASMSVNLAKILDGLPATKGDKNARDTVLTNARNEIDALRTKLKDARVVEVEGNPFLPLSIRVPLTGALDLISKEIVGAA